MEAINILRCLLGNSQFHCLIVRKKFKLDHSFTIGYLNIRLYFKSFL